MRILGAGMALFAIAGCPGGSASSPAPAPVPAGWWG